MFFARSDGGTQAEPGPHRRLALQGSSRQDRARNSGKKDGPSGARRGRIVKNPAFAEPLRRLHVPPVLAHLDLGQ